MNVEQYFDLRIATFENDESIADILQVQQEYDIIRVNVPTPQQREQLLLQGFVLKPTWLIWSRSVHATPSEYISSLSLKARRDLRAAISKAEAICRIHVDENLELERFQHWAIFYEKQMSALLLGQSYLDEYKDEFLTQPDRFLAVYAYADDTLIAGMIYRKLPELSMLRGIFFANDKIYQHVGLCRYIYFTSTNVARSLGFQIISAGVDPNFYGYDVSTGLYLFKKRLGFRAEPEGKYFPPDEIVLEKICSLAKMQNPCFCLGYADHEGRSHKLEGHIFSSSPDTFTVQFQSPALISIQGHVL